MKKNKVVLWIAVVAVVVVVAAVAVWGKQYYENRYVGSDYYTMIPLDYDMTPEMMYDMAGEEAGLGRYFVLTAYNDQGEAKTVEFKVMGDDSAQYPQPGTYLRVNASNQLVVGWNIIDESSVPEKALDKIKGNS